MKRIIVSATDYTPSLDLNPANLTMMFKGVSRPENVGLFYQQVLDWIDDMGDELSTMDDKNLKITFKLEYCNSSTQKYILVILEKLLKLNNEGLRINVDWYYDEDDDKMLEDGEDISDAIGIDFNYDTF